MSMHKVLCIVVTFKQAVKLKNQPAQVQVVCLREAERPLWRLEC